MTHFPKLRLLPPRLRLMPFGCALLAGSWWFLGPAPRARADDLRGLPFIRTYPLDEIGHVPRGLRLGFDAFGRIAVMYDGIYAVLNDTTWVDRIDQAPSSRLQMTTIKFADGQYFYGGRGSWGKVAVTADGSFQAAPLVPENAPDWTSVTPFNKLLGTSQGMYFYELDGVVFWDFARRKNRFFAMPRLSALFTVGDRVFVSCEDRLIRELLPDSGEVRVIEGVGLDRQVVNWAAPLGPTHTLLALDDGRLVSFDGHATTPWSPQSNYRIQGKITAMEPLVEGGVAIAVAGTGVYLFSIDGSLLWSLSVPAFQHVGALAAGESGVLWVAGENAVDRIFYDSPLTSFGQHHGLTTGWPEVARWNDKVVICSNRTLYEAEPALPDNQSVFRVRTGQPASPATCIAASGGHLLAGNAKEVFSVDADGTIRPLSQIDNVAGLAFIQPDTCIAIGSREIAALKYIDGGWVECATRLPGVGDAPVRLRINHEALWIEMGGDRVARLTLRNGVLDLKRIALPWSGAQWTNVGVIGDTVVLSGAEGQRTYYDERKEALREAPELDRLLNRSPYWLSRITEDESGVLWATYRQGIVTFTPQDNDYVVDAATFELRNDSYPAVTILPDNQIWITTGRSLYRVERPTTRKNQRPHLVLVSLVAGQRNLELLNGNAMPDVPARFAFDDNSLRFRFFSGTYAWRSPPTYEYRLGSSESWSPVDPSLVLRFPKLRDGTYRLEVRPAGPHDRSTPAFVYDFVIRPPWYRTPASYAAYVIVLLISIVGIARWINHRSLERNVVLERLVHERTRELEVTMEKLGEETMNAATLAERSRLAGEIHDSLQQGLSGTILHLDTTLTHPSLIPEVQAQLHVMRSMLAYSYEEVQQAVWNLESPLLQNSTLGDALRKIADYIGSGAIAIKVIAGAEPAPLGLAIQHHLLRIAQEAITNAVKHADASHIVVTLQSDSHAVIVSVTDDGKGFDPAACSALGRHFGLRGLRSRAKTIKAHLQIASSPGAGTTVQVTVPLRDSLSHESLHQTQSA